MARGKQGSKSSFCLGSICWLGWTLAFVFSLIIEKGKNNSGPVSNSTHQTTIPLVFARIRTKLTPQNYKENCLLQILVLKEGRRSLNLQEWELQTRPYTTLWPEIPRGLPKPQAES